MSDKKSDESISAFQTNMDSFRDFEKYYSEDCHSCSEYIAYHDPNTVHYGLSCLMAYITNECPCINCLVKVKCENRDCEKFEKRLKELYGLKK